MECEHRNDNDASQIIECRARSGQHSPIVPGTRARYAQHCVTTRHHPASGHAGAGVAVHFVVARRGLDQAKLFGHFTGPGSRAFSNHRPENKFRDMAAMWRPAPSAALRDFTMR
jgi:hypothetical protein